MEGPVRENPPRLSGTWVQAKCGKGGGGRTDDRAQRRVAEDGGERVWTTSNWTEFHAGRGGRDRVRYIGLTQETTTYGWR